MSKNYNNYYKKRNNEKPVEESKTEEVEAKDDTKEEQKEVEDVTPVEEVKETNKEPDQAIVNVDLLNFRESPSKGSKILKVLKKNDVIDIVESTDAWYKISFNGAIGYVMKEYVDIKVR